MALSAFSEAQKLADVLRLVIIGDGPERKRLEKQAERLGIAEKVIFRGGVPREAYIKELAESHVVLNPCLREGGVTLLFDALSWGKPVICLDVSGSSQLVTEKCGIRVRANNEQEAIEAIKEGLGRLASSQGLRQEMGREGRLLAQSHHTWEQKGAFIQKVYSEVVGQVP